MDKKELREAIQVLERAKVSVELLEMLKEVENNTDSDEVYLVNTVDYLATIMWQKADIVLALEDADVYPSDENVLEVIREVKDNLEDCSHGWEIIEEAVYKIRKKPDRKLV